jgi:hypothetical protein
MALPKKQASGWKAQAEKMKQDLLKRTEEAANRQKEGTSARANYFIKEKVGNLPFFTPGKGEHIIDIVPFVAGRQDPRNPEGAYAYVVDLWAHFNVGAGNEAVVCPRLNFQKKCPICDYMRANRLERKEWERIRPKRRTIYLVWPHDEDSKMEKKGLHLWDVAHWYFEDKITEIAKKPRGGGYILFQSPDKDGKQIRFKVEEGQYTDKDTGATGKRNEYKGHSFLDRDEDLPEKIVNHGIHLDELINMKPSVKEIEVKFAGEEEPPAEEEPETEEPLADEEPEPEAAEEEPENEPEPEQAEDDLDALDRTNLKKYIKENGLDVKVFKNDSDDDIRAKIREATGGPVEEPEEAPEEEPAEEPPADEPDEFEEMSRDEMKRYIVKNGLKDTVKVFKTDSDDDLRAKLREAVGGAAAEEPEPPKTPAKGKGKTAAAPKKGPAPECPAGGTYGKDADQHEECLECKHYKACAAESGA